jgi:hypothetical protein
MEFILILKDARHIQLRVAHSTDDWGWVSSTDAGLSSY